MSYSLSVADEARDALASLEFWLQEETLDEIEQLLHDPARLALRLGEVVAIHDFTRTSCGRTHYVFLTLRPNPEAQILQLLGVGHFER